MKFTGRQLEIIRDALNLAQAELIGQFNTADCRMAKGRINGDIDELAKLASTIDKLQAIEVAHVGQRV